MLFYCAAAYKQKQLMSRPPVLGLALLQHIFLIQELTKRDILLVQQRLQMRGCVQVKLPKHGDRHEHTLSC